MKGQAGPDIHETESFANHIEGLAGGAPPVPGSKGIAGRAPHDGAPLASCKPVPEQADASRMGFGGHKNYGFAIPTLESMGGDSDFVGRVPYRRFENVNRSCGDAFVNQNKLVVIVLASEGNAHRF